MWKYLVCTFCTCCTLFLSAASEAQTTYRLRSAIGTNLNAIQYWSTEQPFIDLMKSASDWRPMNIQTTTAAFSLDANGWITSLPAGTAAVTTIAPNVTSLPTGLYTVLYQGTGDFKFNGATVVSQVPGKVILNVAPGTSGIQLNIYTTTAGNYLRNFQILMPGGICTGDPYTVVAGATSCVSGPFLSFADNSSRITFYPPFLAQLKNYSVLRFMNWMLGASSESPVTNWSQRTPATYRTYTGASGAPIEVMIALANALGTHPWFTIPHLTDDSYVRSLATLINQQLNANLRVYVEYSNEVWNQQFAQSAYAAQQGALQSPPISATQYYALRAHNVGATFKNVLGSARVVTVYAAQAAGNGAPVTTALTYLKSRFGGVTGIDAIAIAPYLNVNATPDTASTFTAMSLTAFFNYVNTTVLPKAVTNMKALAGVAKANGLPLIAYEGGQSVVAVGSEQNDAVLTNLFTGFNRDPRIKQIYLSYLNQWKAAGGQLFVHYTDISQFAALGYWGALEYPTQPRAQAPKYDALQTFITSNPVWWTQ